MDHDRLEVGNIMRHLLCLSDVGRYKVLAMADYLRGKNPYLDVQTSTEKVDWDNIEFVRSLVKEADLAICASGEKKSKRIMNKLCLQEGKVLIIGGAFRRAYGGSVLLVRPRRSLCYQCFLQLFPQETQDEEISNAEQAEGLAYTDQVVPIEPGLATDILPISTMVVKLAIQELLQDTETTLRSLDEDLVAPLYLWANRREGQFEHLKPLGFSISSMSPLRWYGVRISRDPACVECGDFTEGLASEYDIEATDEDMRAFEDDDNEG
jgi:molybdopterin/thiamine biosynthesis adenylyltransferase